VSPCYIACQQHLLQQILCRRFLSHNYITAGEAQLTLEKKEDHYQLVLETKPSGVFRFTDKGKIKEVAELPSLAPPYLSNKYTYINFGDKDRNYTSVYNRNKGEATIVRRNGVKRMAIDATAVDRVSMTLALMQKLREQPEIEEFSINTIDGRGPKTFSFASKGQVKLQTEIGTLTATRIDRLRSANNKRNIITWIFAELRRLCPRHQCRFHFYWPTIDIFQNDLISL